MPNPYETLGVEPDATPDEIKAAGRRAASQAHPDRPGGSTERMQAVNAARAILEDPERRAAFDANGTTGEEPTLEQKAENMLREYLDLAIEKAPAGQVLEHVATLIGEVHKVCTLERAKAQQEAKRLATRREKIHTTAGVRNLAHEVIDHKLEKLANIVRAADGTIPITEEARRMLKAYGTTEERPIESIRRYQGFDDLAFAKPWQV